MTKNKQTFSITGTAEILIPDKLGRTSYLAALLIILVMTALISVTYTKLPQTIPLYFSLPWGEARLAPKMMFFSLPGMSLLLLMLNLFLGRISTKLSPILPRVLAVASVVVAAMLLFATLGIIQSLVL